MAHQPPDVAPATARTGTAVVLGVGGGIAAYKVADLLRLLTESGHDVRVVPTAAALEFVGAPTWAALSGHPVTTDVWDDVDQVPHVRIGQRGRPGRRRPGDRRPAGQGGPRPGRRPAHQHAAHRPLPGADGARPCTPRCGSTRPPGPTSRRCGRAACTCSTRPSGRLTGADTGPGRLPEPEEIFAAATGAARLGAADADRVAGRRDLAGRRVVVTAGGTREHLDPVRFLGNRSSAAGRATRWPAPPPPAAPRWCWSRPTSRCPTRPGVNVVPVGVGARSCATRCSAPRPRPTRW